MLNLTIQAGEWICLAPHSLIPSQFPISLRDQSQALDVFPQKIQLSSFYTRD